MEADIIGRHAVKNSDFAIVASKVYLNKLLQGLELTAGRDNYIVKVLSAGLSGYQHIGFALGSCSREEADSYLQTKYGLAGQIKPATIQPYDVKYLIEAPTVDPKSLVTALSGHERSVFAQKSFTLKSSDGELNSLIIYGNRPQTAVYDLDRRKITDVDGDEIFLPAALARDYRIGDDITLEIGEESLTLKIAGFIDSSSALFSLQSLRSFKEIYLSIGAEIIGTAFGSDSKELLENADGITYSSAFGREQSLEDVASFATMKRFIDLTKTILFLVCGFIMLSLVYNIGVISLSERKNDIKVMKALGLSRSKINTLNSSENIFIAAVGGLLALPIGYFLARTLLWRVYRIVLISLKATVSLPSLLILIAGVVALTVMANILINNRVNHMDLAAILKEEN